MPDTLFQQALAFTLAQEGNWSDNEADTGGPTMRGITLTVFRAWRHDSSATPSKLRVISAGEVQAIYRGLYWNPVRGAYLHPGVGLLVFDAAVNLGVRCAALLLQRTLSVSQDGAIGPETLGEAGREAPGVLIGKLAGEREAFYRSCRAFPVFGRGWLARNQACFLAACRAAGLSESDSELTCNELTVA
jgi:lysozyme family protein